MILVCVIAPEFVPFTARPDKRSARLTGVLSQAVNFLAVDSGNAIIYYKAFDQEVKLTGAVFKAEAKRYCSGIKILA